MVSLIKQKTINTNIYKPKPTTQQKNINNTKNILILLLFFNYKNLSMKNYLKIDININDKLTNKYFLKIK